MRLTRLITQFTYRIEPKAGGGFVAHASDPNVAPLEAATREELQAKIQARVAEALAKEFPALKVPLDRPGRKFEFHIEMKPGGGFALHSADPHAPPIHGATHDDLRSHVAERLVAIAGRDAGPEFALAAQSRTGGGSLMSASAGALGQAAGVLPAAQPPPQLSGVWQPIGSSSTLGPTKAARTVTVVRVVLLVIALAALVSFFFVSRR